MNSASLVAAADRRIALATSPACADPRLRFSLLHAAGAALIRAKLDGTTDAPWQSVIAQERLRDVPHADALFRLLEDADPLAVESIPDREVTAHVETLEAVVLDLRADVDVRTRRQRWGDRARVSAAAAVLVGALGVAALQLAGPAVVSKGARVVTSTHPEGRAEDALLVDGKVHSPFGASATKANEAWIAVDLFRLHRIDRIRVLNRRDCCFGDDLPYTLEVSRDGLAWQRVGVRGERWNPNDAWEVKLGATVARWVRVRTLVPGTGIALSSLEVRGKPHRER